MTNKNICNISGSSGGKEQKMYNAWRVGSVSAKCLSTFATRDLQLIVIEPALAEWGVLGYGGIWRYDVQVQHRRIGAHLQLHYVCGHDQNMDRFEENMVKATDRATQVAAT
ncbi:hypothetical protein AAHE18_12G064400 [Arachis hypogaea]